jgi:hypothetical protein
MIYLPEIAQRLEKILNGVDIQTGASPLSTDYQFQVKAVGIRIDSVADFSTNKNVIPVLIDFNNGSFNPVPGLKQREGSIHVAIYFPVRFKNDMLLLDDFLADSFVGQNHYWGKITGGLLTNINQPRLGELQNVDLNKFVKAINSSYRVTFTTTEVYMSLEFDLYYNSVADGYVYSNTYRCSQMKFVDSQGVEHTITNPRFADASIQMSSEPAGQQLLGGQPEIAGLPVNTSIVPSFALYVKNETFFKRVMREIFNGNIQKCKFYVEITFLGENYTKECFLTSFNLPIKYGTLATITFTFSKRIED